MKLLILDQFSEPGGAQQALLDLLPAMRVRGWDVLVGLPGDGELFRLVRAAGFAAERIECGPYGSGRKSAADVARFLLGTPRLARKIAGMAADADLVYINGPRLLPAASLARLGTPVVFHAHSVLPSGPSRWLARSALLRLDARVIASCEFVAATWRKYARRVNVVYNGVSDGAGGQSMTSGRTVACIGRIAPEKGQLEFLAVAAAMFHEAPDCRFVIYGAPLFSAGAYAREVRARAAGLPVEFAGWTADVAAALARTDILLVPSSPVEGTTRVILEAYAAGVPVVAFANGGIPEVVEHGRTGFLARSVGEMARFALALLRNPAMRFEISTAARERWQERFTLERCRRDVLAILETARRPAAPVPPLQPAQGRSRSA